MEKQIRHQWNIAHAPERVWHYLTQAELISQWLMPNDFKAEVGHQFMFNAKPYPEHDFDGKVYCEVLEVVPNERLSYSWKSGNADGKVKLDTIVTWTLLPTDVGTELTLVQSGFKEGINDMAYVGMNAGWGKHIAERFAALLNASADA